MKKRVLSLLTAGALVASALTGCGSSSAESTAAASGADAGTEAAAAADGDTISFGVIAPLTGPHALYGEAGKNGVNLALKEINEAGGVKIGDKSYTLNAAVICDDKSDSTEAISAYNNCASYDIVGIIGTYASSCTKAFATQAQSDGLVVITPVSTNASICKIGDYIFRACFSDDAQGPAMAAFIKDKLGAKKAAIIYGSNEDYCTGLYESISKYFDENSVDYVVYECTSTDTDFSAQVSKVVAEGCDAIAYPNYLDTAPMLIQQARAAGFTGGIVGGDGWDGCDTTGLEADFENTYYLNHLDFGDTSEAVQSFVTKYTEAYGSDSLCAPGALYYDTVYMLKQAIEEAGSADPAAIKDALAKIDFNGVTGHVTFDENGDPIKAFTIETFEDGKVTYFDKVGGEES